MDFFNDFGRRVNRMVRGVTEKENNESTALSRVTAELRARLQECDKLFTELGKLCYAGTDDTQRLRDLTLEIDELQARIQELTNQRDAMRAPRRCPSCGSVQAHEARFCSNCGKRLTEDAPIVADPAADADYCPNCGAAREGEGSVCAVCGHAFDAEPETIPEAQGTPVIDINTEEPDDSTPIGE